MVTETHRNLRHIAPQHFTLEFHAQHIFLGVIRQQQRRNTFDAAIEALQERSEAGIVTEGLQHVIGGGKHGSEARIILVVATPGE